MVEQKYTIVTSADSKDESSEDLLAMFADCKGPFYEQEQLYLARKAARQTPQIEEDLSQEPVINDDVDLPFFEQVFKEEFIRLQISNGDKGEFKIPDAQRQVAIEQAQLKSSDDQQQSAIELSQSLSLFQGPKLDLQQEESKISYSDRISTPSPFEKIYKQQFDCSPEVDNTNEPTQDQFVTPKKSSRLNKESKPYYSDVFRQYKESTPASPIYDDSRHTVKQRESFKKAQSRYAVYLSIAVPEAFKSQMHFGHSYIVAKGMQCDTFGPCNRPQPLKILTNEQVDYFWKAWVRPRNVLKTAKFCKLINGKWDQSGFVKLIAVQHPYRSITVNKLYSIKELTNQLSQYPLYYKHLARRCDLFRYQAQDWGRWVMMDVEFKYVNQIPVPYRIAVIFFIRCNIINTLDVTLDIQQLQWECKSAAMKQARLLQIPDTNLGMVKSLLTAFKPSAIAGRAPKVDLRILDLPFYYKEVDLGDYIPGSMDDVYNSSKSNFNHYPKTDLLMQAQLLKLEAGYLHRLLAGRGKLIDQKGTLATEVNDKKPIKIPKWNKNGIQRGSIVVNGVVVPDCVILNPNPSFNTCAMYPFLYMLRNKFPHLMTEYIKAQSDEHGQDTIDGIISFLFSLKNEDIAESMMLQNTQVGQFKDMVRLWHKGDAPRRSQVEPFMEHFMFPVFDQEIPIHISSEPPMMMIVDNSSEVSHARYVIAYNGNQSGKPVQLERLTAIFGEEFSERVMANREFTFEDSAAMSIPEIQSAAQTPCNFLIETKTGLELHMPCKNTKTHLIARDGFYYEHTTQRATQSINPLLKMKDVSETYKKYVMSAEEAKLIQSSKPAKVNKKSNLQATYLSKVTEALEYEQVNLIPKKLTQQTQINVHEPNRVKEIVQKGVPVVNEHGYQKCYVAKGSQSQKLDDQNVLQPLQKIERSQSNQAVVAQVATIMKAEKATKRYGPFKLINPYQTGIDLPFAYSDKVISKIIQPILDKQGIEYEQYSDLIKYGKQVIDGKNCVRSFSKNNGHAGFRTAANWLFGRLVRSARNFDFVVDIGSKFKYAANILSQLGFQGLLIVYRPRDSVEDKSYWDKNFPKDYSMGQEVLYCGTRTVFFDTYVNSETVVYPRSLNIAMDSGYYLGVMEYLQKCIQAGQKAVGAMLAFPHLTTSIMSDGSSYGNEALYKVHRTEAGQQVSMKCVGNSGIYQHPVGPLNGSCLVHTPILDSVIFIEDSLQVGIRLHYVQFTLKDGSTWQPIQPLEYDSSIITEKIKRFALESTRTMVQTQNSEFPAIVNNAACYAYRELTDNPTLGVIPDIDQIRQISQEVIGMQLQDNIQQNRQLKQQWFCGVDPRLLPLQSDTPNVSLKKINVERIMNVIQETRVGYREVLNTTTLNVVNSVALLLILFIGRLMPIGLAGENILIFIAISQFTIVFMWRFHITEWICYKVMWYQAAAEYDKLAEQVSLPPFERTKDMTYTRDANLALSSLYEWMSWQDHSTVFAPRYLNYPIAGIKGNVSSNLLLISMFSTIFCFTFVSIYFLNYIQGDQTLQYDSVFYNILRWCILCVPSCYILGWHKWLNKPIALLVASVVVLASITPFLLKHFNLRKYLTHPVETWQDYVGVDTTTAEVEQEFTSIILFIFTSLLAVVIWVAISCIVIYNGTRKLIRRRLVLDHVALLLDQEERVAFQSLYSKIKQRVNTHINFVRLQFTRRVFPQLIRVCQRIRARIVIFPRIFRAYQMLEQLCNKWTFIFFLCLVAIYINRESFCGAVLKWALPYACIFIGYMLPINWPKKMILLVYFCSWNIFPTITAHSTIGFIAFIAFCFKMRRLYRNRRNGCQQQRLAGSVRKSKTQLLLREKASKPLRLYAKPYAQQKIAEKCNDTLTNVRYFGFGGNEITSAQLQKNLQTDNSISLEAMSLTHPGYKFNDKRLNDVKLVNPSAHSVYHMICSRHCGNPQESNLRVRAEYLRKLAPVVNDLIRDLNLSLDNMELLTMQDYIDQMPGKKKATYQNMWDRYMENTPYRFKYRLIPNLKRGENLFGPDSTVRSRAVWDPSEHIKLFGGLINFNMIQITKDALPDFVSGMNLDEVAEKIKNMSDQSAEGYYIGADGASHDSSQKQWWIKAVDEKILRILAERILYRLGFDFFEVRETMKVILQSKFRFNLYYPHSRRRMMTATLTGTVTSGHPTKTTWGNTVRMWTMCEVIRRDAQLSKYQFKHIHGGDDALFYVSKSSMISFCQAAVKYVNLNPDVIKHGIGYVWKDVMIHTNIFDFLSRVGWVDKDRALIQRKGDRLLQSGNYTSRVNNTLTVAQYNYGVTKQLEQVAGEHPLYQSYIDERFKISEQNNLYESYRDSSDWYKAQIYNVQERTAAYWEPLTDMDLSNKVHKTIPFENQPFYYDYTKDNFKSKTLAGSVKRITLIGNPINHKKQFNTQRYFKTTQEKMEEPSPITYTAEQVKQLLNKTLSPNVQKFDSFMQNQTTAPQGQTGITNPGQVQRAMQRWKLPRKQRYAQAGKKLADLDMKKSIADLVRLFQEGNLEVKQRMTQVDHAVNPFYNMRTSTIKDQYPDFTYAQKAAADREGFNTLMQYDAAKLDVDPAEVSAVLDKLLEELKSVAPDLKKDELKELVALDFFPGFAQTLHAIGRKVIPMIPSLVSYAREKWIDPHKHKSKILSTASDLLKKMGMDEGYQARDWQNAPDGQKPAFRVVNTATQQLYGTNSPANSIQTLICPEYYASKAPMNFPKDDALTGYVQSIPVVVNANGEAQFRILPYGGEALVNYFNGADYVAQTGLGTALSLESRLYTALGANCLHRIVGMAISFVPLYNEETVGAVDICWIDDGRIAGAQALSLENMQKFPFYASSSGRTNRRVIVPWNERSEKLAIMNAGDEVQPQYAFTFTAFPATTCVGHLVCSIVDEYVPSLTTAVMVQMESPLSDITQLQYLRNVISRYPMIQTMEAPQAAKLAAQITDPHQTMAQVENFFSNYPVTGHTRAVTTVSSAEQDGHDTTIIN